MGQTNFSSLSILEMQMNKRYAPFAIVATLAVAGAAVAQGAILDMVANKTVAKYQASTCEQLWAAKGQPKSAEEQKAVQFLRNDPSARTAFIDKVAGPVVNKLFECGMVP
jgi:hypothetical protein